MKFILLPIAMILLFGGGLLAVNRPLPIRAAIGFVGAGLCILVASYSAGFVRFAAVICAIFIAGLMGFAGKIFKERS